LSPPSKVRRQNKAIDPGRLEVIEEEIQHQCSIIIPVSTSHIAVIETAGNLAVIGGSGSIDLTIAVEIAVN
jgi:hypothetical protein